MTKKINEIKWMNLLRVDKNAFLNWFNLQEEVIVSKEVKIKFYSIKYKDNLPDDEGFINHLYSQVEKYVFDEKNVKELREDGIIPTEKALGYFGNVDPLSDGRYGELILYLSSLYSQEVKYLRRAFRMMLIGLVLSVLFTGVFLFL